MVSSERAGVENAGPRAWRAAAVGLVVVAVALAGCAGAPVAPTYTPDELEAICERGGGWWRPNILGGYCEPNSQI